MGRRFGYNAGMNTCHACDDVATRACTICGKFCCARHIFGGDSLARVTCGDCRDKTSRALGIAGLLALAAVVLVVVIQTVIGPAMKRRHEEQLKQNPLVLPPIRGPSEPRPAPAPEK